MVALAASQDALRERKEATDKVTEQYKRQAEQQSAKLREAETARDKLKAEVADVRRQLDTARADSESQQKAAAAAREEAERQKAALAASQKSLREQKEAAETAAVQYRQQVEQQGMALREAETARDKLKVGIRGTRQQAPGPL